MQRYFVRKLTPREVSDLKDVMEELDEVVDVARDVFALGAGRRSDEFITDVVGTASGGYDDVLEA